MTNKIDDSWTLDEIEGRALAIYKESHSPSYKLIAELARIVSGRGPSRQAEAPQEPGIISIPDVVAGLVQIVDGGAQPDRWAIYVGGAYCGGRWSSREHAEDMATGLRTAIRDPPRVGMNLGRSLTSGRAAATRSGL